MVISMTPNTTQDNSDMIYTEVEELSLSERLKMLADDDFVGVKRPAVQTQPSVEEVNNKRKTVDDKSTSGTTSEGQDFKKQKSSVESSTKPKNLPEPVKVGVVKQETAAILTEANDAEVETIKKTDGKTVSVKSDAVLSSVKFKKGIQVVVKKEPETKIKKELEVKVTKESETKVKKELEVVLKKEPETKIRKELEVKVTKEPEIKIKRELETKLVKEKIQVKKEPEPKTKKQLEPKIKKEPEIKAKKRPEIKVKKETGIKIKKATEAKKKPGPKVKKETEAKVKQETALNTNGKEEEGDEEYRWWENHKEDDSIKWESLEHSGPYFPPEYTPINIPLVYNQKELFLEPEAEEVAGFFAALLNSDHATNPIFRKNFFDDFRGVLAQINSKHVKTIVDLGKCDFGKMHAYLEQQRELRKNATKQEKEVAKEAKKEIDDKYGFCLLDNRKEKVGNFRIEPPGLFRGRGTHPKAGKLKSRVKPEQVTLNLGEGTVIPEAPAGHRWGAVQHDKTVTWLATWTENINKSQKYVFLAAGSSLKGQSDYKKFETARMLKDHVDHIRRRNAEELQSSDMFVRQRATALWLIDNLALRAGNEKGDDEADTVGCCSLRLEHVKLRPPTGIVFDFLGKDSIRYYRELEIDPQIIKNLTIFMKQPKEPGHPIFDRLNTQLLNKYLSELMPGLTAKVFRTFNASFTFQRELDSGTPIDASAAEKVLAYNRANRYVAILCNHQRSIPKTHGQAMERLNEKLSILKFERRLLRGRMKSVLSKKERSKIPGIEEDESDLDVGKTEELLLLRESEKVAKKKAGNEIEVDSEPPSSPSNKKLNPVDQLRDRIGRTKEEGIEKKFVAINSRLSALRLQMMDRDENKTTALGTSKTNYIDPRITAAWCARHGVSLEKMFNKSLRDKFKWAMTVDKEWKF